MSANTLETVGEITANSLTFGAYGAARSAYSFHQGDNTGGFQHLAGAAVGPDANAGVTPAAGSTAESYRARAAQQKLESQRADQLTQQAADKAAADARAARTGQTFGIYSTFGEAFGFGTGNAPQGVGRGNLF